jgi:type VI secretion system secreted protein VgrG
MPYTQDNRSIAIATPLGKDKLLLRALTISEQLGRPFVMRADLLSEESSLDFLKIIGKGVTIRWRMPEASGGEEKRFFSGYVSSFVQRPRADGFYRYEATIVPWLWFLTRTADCRIFHDAMNNPPEDMTIPGIIKKVFKDHGFDDVTPALTGSYRTLDHCVQYRETDFNFVSRLMEQEGIYYFFEHQDEGGSIKHKLKLADAKSAHSEYPGYETLKFRATTADAAEAKGTVLDWARVKQVQPGTYKVNDFDFKRPKTSLLGSSTQEDSHSNDAFEIYDFCANYADEDSGEHGDAYAKLRIEELKAQHDIIMGRSDCPGIACGCKFKLEGHPRDDENAEYLVVAVNCRCTAETFKQSGAQSDVKIFQCDFTAIPADHSFRPARVTQKPRIQGPQTAIVVGKAGEETLTDEYGRIKVQFHWDRYSPANENSPCWVRVAHSWAGKNWGSVFIPRIGQEVIVEFLDGNPDRPIVTGAVYNGESKPPYPLPDNATMSTIKSNSSKGGQGFNEFRFEDKKGSEQIFLHAEKDQDIRVKEVTKEWIGKDRHLIVKENQREMVEKDKHAHVKGDQLLKVEGNYGRAIQKNEVAKISGNDHLAVDGDYVQKIGGNLHQKITGNHHEQTTGDIRLTATGNADIKATQNAAVVSDMNVHLKGGMVVVVEAGMQLSLKAGANFIDIGPAGISIQGTMVNINMGGAAGSGSGAQAASPSAPNDPDSVTDPTEAAKADPGSSDTAKTAPSPPTPTQFSASAIALQEAAAGASPMVESPTDSSTAASDAAANANAASAAATAGANAASTAGASASGAAASTNAAVVSASVNASGNSALTAACNTAAAAAAAATTAAANATAAAATATAAATNAASAAANASASVSAGNNGDNDDNAADASAAANAAAGAAYTAAANANTAAANATVAAANANAAAANLNVAAAAAPAGANA